MDNTITVIELIPAYSNLKDIYSQVIRSRGISFINQCQVTSFYNQYYGKIKGFDRMIVDLLMQKDHHTCGILINRLKNTILEIIKIYDQNNELLNSLDIDSICQKVARQYDTVIQEQSHKTREYSKELNNIDGTLDMLPYRESSKDEEQFLSRKRDSVKVLYNEEKKKLSSFYELQKEAWDAAGRNNKNRFEDIHSLSLSLLMGIESYFTDRDHIATAGDKEITPPVTTAPYFDMGIISAVHKECNGQQFEAIAEIDLYNILNLLPSPCNLSIRPGEKTRICYLIYKLYESINTPLKTQWRTDILKKLNIKESLYLAKYKEPVSDLPSRKSENFSERINELFL
jgi:hypothetical protein